MGVVTTQAPTGQRSQTTTKNLATGWIYCVNCYIENMFRKFSSLKVSLYHGNLTPGIHLKGPGAGGDLGMVKIQFYVVFNRGGP